MQPSRVKDGHASIPGTESRGKAAGMAAQKRGPGPVVDGPQRHHRGTHSGAQKAHCPETREGTSRQGRGWGLGSASVSGSVSRMTASSRAGDAGREQLGT